MVLFVLVIVVGCWMLFVVVVLLLFDFGWCYCLSCWWFRLALIVVFCLVGWLLSVCLWDCLQFGFWFVLCFLVY